MNDHYVIRNSAYNVLGDKLQDEYFSESQDNKFRRFASYFERSFDVLEYETKDQAFEALVEFLNKTYSHTPERKYYLFDVSECERKYYVCFIRDNEVIKTSIYLKLIPEEFF